MTDQEQMASLFVSDEGELRLEPEWDDDEGGESVLMARAGVQWSRVIVPEAVAAGILRLIRERDEARAALKQYGRHSSQCYDPCAIVCACVCGLAAVLEAKEEPGSE